MYKYIQLKKDKYIVRVRWTEPKFNFQKQYDTLKEAIKSRDEQVSILEEIKLKHKKEIENSPITKTEEGVCYINITNSYDKNKTKSFVSEEDWYNLNNYNWSISNMGYCQGKVNNKNIALHSYILGKKEGYVIDHINGDRLDNRRENLRHITPSQNAQNKTTKTIIGVWKHLNKWSSEITYNKRKIYVGVFNSMEEARKMYDKYVIYYHTLDNTEYIPRTNFNYEKESIEKIKVEMEEYISNKNKEKKLPDNISIRENGTYRIGIDNKKLSFHFDKTVKTLDEAIVIRDQKLKELSLLEEQELKKHYSKDIQRTKEGIPCISLKDKDNISYALVDEDNWHELMLYSWRVSKTYAATTVNNVPLRMHRYIMNCSYNDNKIVDHINGNRLDNRKENLRFVTHIENCLNNKSSRSQVEEIKKDINEIYITPRKYNYQVRIENKKLNFKVHNSFNKLEDAIEFRNIHKDILEKLKKGLN